MKKTVFVGIASMLIGFLLWNVSLCAAAPMPEGFVGVPWGASRAQIKHLMNERGWVKYTGTAPNAEVFKGAFDGREGDLHFVMVGDSFVEGVADALAKVPVKNSSATKSAYDATVRRLTEKYGPPTKTADFETYGSRDTAVWGPATIWELGDGITIDKYRIRVILNNEGTYFTGVQGKHTYYTVIYEAISLRDRLQKQNL